MTEPEVAAILDEHRAHWLQNRSMWRKEWQKVLPPIAQCPVLACRRLAALPEVQAFLARESTQATT